jgi:hypothetical protein
MSLYLNILIIVENRWAIENLLLLLMKVMFCDLALKTGCTDEKFPTPVLSAFNCHTTNLVSQGTVTVVKSLPSGPFGLSGTASCSLILYILQIVMQNSFKVLFFYFENRN